MDKIDYESKGEDFFFDYLPDEVFHSLNEEERIHYREYRRYHRLLYQNKKRVEFYEQEIERLKNLIKEEKKKTKKDLDNDRFGWEFEMKEYYEHISHLHDKFELRVGIEVRNRSSKSHKIKTKEKRKGLLEVVKKSYGDKKIDELHIWYSVARSIKNNFKKQMYLGTREQVCTKLGDLYDEDLFLKSDNHLIRELQLMSVQYTRYKVFNSNWSHFLEGTHNLDTMIEWIKRFEFQGKDRSRWGTWEDL